MTSQGRWTLVSWQVVLHRCRPQLILRWGTRTTIRLSMPPSGRMLRSLGTSCSLAPLLGRLQVASFKGLQLQVSFNNHHRLSTHTIKDRSKEWLKNQSTSRIHYMIQGANNCLRAETIARRGQGTIERSLCGPGTTTGLTKSKAAFRQAIDRLN